MAQFRMKTARSVGLWAGILALLLVEAGAVAESDWPHWRGPTGNGISPDGRPPVEFGESSKLAWKVKIPGKGSASPVVSGSRVFVASAVPVGEAQRFVLLSIDRKSGRTLWTRTAAETTPHEGHHETHGFASASPFTDGKRVYAYFGSRGLFCYDLEGNELWKRTDFGQMRTRNGFGEGSSPTIHGDTVLVPWDHEGPSYLIALDKTTGATRWKADREDEPSCWATPLVVAHGDKLQVVTSGETFARSYDFETGEELWRCGGQTVRPVASPVAGHGLVFIGSGHRGSFLAAFRLDRRGDLEGTEGVAWSISRDTPDVPSPVLSGRRLYFFSGRKGILSCLDAATGKPFFSTQRIEGIRDVYASPVAANGKVYLTSRDGTIVVIEDAEELKLVATNQLEEGVDATPAIAGEDLLVRGQEHLYRFTAEAEIP